MLCEVFRVLIFSIITIAYVLSSLFQLGKHINETLKGIVIKSQQPFDFEKLRKQMYLSFREFKLSGFHLF